MTRSGSPHQGAERTNGLSRRRLLAAGIGALGCSLAEFFHLRAVARAGASHATSQQPSGKAKSCIVLFCWGGMSHLDTLDMKPHAPAEVRGEFSPISTATPGLFVSEHLPLLAARTQRVAIVRSMRHGCAGHGKAMYWNMTGHAPPNPGLAANLPPSREDWPSLGAMVGRLATPPDGFPAAVRLPYPLVDNNTLQAGEYGGWLGMRYDPIVLRTPGGTPFGGVSRSLGAAELHLGGDFDRERLEDRGRLLAQLERPLARETAFEQADYFRGLATDMLLEPCVQQAFDLDREPAATRAAYGDHICGRSLLLARRLTSAGVPLVTVTCAAGDLNGSAGDHWDTHGDNFNRLKRTMLPVLDHGLSTLLDDLAASGQLDETLVVLLTEFGRTPRVNGGAGRDHYPGCYSIALAGAGVQGGQAYGESDTLGVEPRSRPIGPADVHATIFTALGLDPASTLHDPLGRPFAACDGRPLPVF